MKKLFTLFVLMAGCFAFAACSDDSGDDSNPGTDQPGGDIEEGQKPIYRHGKVEMVSSSSNLKIIVTTFNVGDTLIVDYGNGYSAEVIADGVEWENDAEGNDREYGSVTLEYSYSASEERTILIEGNMSGLNLNSIHLVSLDLSDCLDIEKFECADLFTYGTIGQSGWVTVTEGELTSLDLTQIGH